MREDWALGSSHVTSVIITYVTDIANNILEIHLSFTYMLNKHVLLFARKVAQKSPNKVLLYVVTTSASRSITAGDVNPLLAAYFAG